MTTLIGAAALAVAVAVFAAPAGAEAAPGTSDEVCRVDGRSVVDSLHARWAELVDRRESLTEAAFRREAGSIIGDAFALGSAARRMTGGRWERLDSHRRAEVEEALRRAIRRAALSAFTRGTGGTGGLEFVDRERVDGSDRLRYRLDGGGTPLVFHLSEDGEGSCAIHDVTAAGDRLLDRYRERARKLLDEYSFPYMIAEIAGDSAVVLEDFESTPEGALPEGWDWKDADDDSRKPYRVRIEDGNRYLEATDEGASVILGREIKWNLEEYPYVSFRVRVHRIPEGGDERYDDRVDSAAGLYFTYRKKLFGKIPESVKYVWSSTLPVGAAAIRDGVGRPWQVVFGSGREGLGEWRTYVFDLRDAYRRTFGGDPPSKPIGIGILSDANSTNSAAYADYDDIRALKSAPPGVDGGVDEILTP